MKKIAGAVCTALLAIGFTVTPAMAADVTVTLPTFPVTLNGVTMEQSNSQYPMLVYRDITYVPMTWADTRLLGLESNWTQQGGLVIEKAATVQDTASAQKSYTPYKASAANRSSYSAVTASGKVTVGGTAIDNSSEQYPLLVFRDVTYFPLTWRFAVNSFGWNYSFDQTNGLVIVPQATSSSTISSTNTSGSPVGQQVQVTGTNVNLRADAGTSNSVVGQANKGDTYTVLAVKAADNRDWYQITMKNGNSAWIAGWLTKTVTDESVSTSTGSSSQANSDTTGTNNMETSNNGNLTASTVNAMVGKKVVVTGSVVNLRSNTSTTSAVIGQTVKGDTYTVLAAKTVDGSDWYQITTKNGAKAWIAGWLTEEATSGTNTTNTNNNTNTNTNTNTNNNTNTNTNSTTDNTNGTTNNSSTTTTYENYDVVGKTVTVTANGVNLREEPGTGSTSVGTVSRGTTFTVLTLRTVDGEQWYQVKNASGNKVWLASWLTDRAASNGTITGQTKLSVQSVQQQGRKTMVTIKHGAGNGYSTSQVSATEMTLQLSNTYVSASDKLNQSYSDGPLRQLQVKDPGSGMIQVVFTLQKGAYSTVKESGDNLIVTVYNQHEAGEQGLVGKTIVIDPGHGGSDPGAVGRVLGVTDANVGLTVGQKLQALLEAQGATVIMTRDTDVRVGLSDRPAMANQAEADLFVSIHANSSTNTAPSGIQVYYYAPTTNANLYAQSYVRKELATQVSDGMQAATGTASVVKTANYAVLRENDRPSILVETGFLSNAAEEALLASDSYRQQLADGIYQGILNYLNQF